MDHLFLKQQANSGLRRSLRLGATALALFAMAACGGGGGGGSTPVAPPVATSLVASSATPLFGDTFTLTPTYSAGTGAIDNGVTCPATGVASAPITANWTTGARIYTLTVTNSASAAATTTATVTPQTVVVGAVSPAAASVAPGAHQTFTATATGGLLGTVTWSATALGNANAGTMTAATGAWVAPATTGTVTITATSTDDTTKSASTTVTVTAAPTSSIVSFTPTTGAAGTVVTITGTNLAGTTAVSFHGAAGTGITNIDATHVSAVVPSTASTGTIAVTTPLGTATSSGSFTFISAPTIASFTPTSGGAGTVVTLTGTNLAGTTAISFHGTAGTGIVNIDATHASAVVPAGATTGTVSVTTPGGSATSANSFTFVSTPTITSFTPISGGAGTVVTLTGTNLAGTTAISFNGTAGTGIVNIDATHASAVVPTGATTGTVSVTTPGGSATSSGSFTFVAAPTITSFTPTTGGAGTVVTLTGTNLAGTTAISFHGAAGTGIVNIDAAHASAVVPSGASTGTISVTAAGGSATSTGSFTFVAAPTITSFTPTTGGAGTVVTLTGTNLAGTTAISFNGAAGTGIVNIDATHASAVVPSGASTGTVSVTTPGGSATSSGSFTFIAAPAISSFSPVYGWPGTVVTLTGTHLAGTTAISFNGTPGTGIVNIDATHASAVVPALAVGGAITVTTPGGSADTSLLTPSSFSAGKLSVLSGVPSGVGDTNGFATGPTLARFNEPIATAIDSLGNIYVADYDNNTIRMIDHASGQVTTPYGVAGQHGFADGNGTGARFFGPTSMVIDGTGTYLYVADSWNSTIRKITLATKDVITLAGTPETFGYANAASSGTNTAGVSVFDFTEDNVPVGLAFAADGNLFVSDQGHQAPGNYVIRKVNVTTGAVTLFAGTPGTQGSANGAVNTATFTNPLGLARIGNNLYVADGDTNAIRIVDATTGAVSTMTLSAPLDNPVGLATDGVSLFETDNNGNTVNMISQAGTVTPLAGLDQQAGSIDNVLGTTARFTSPCGLSVSTLAIGTHPAGTLFVADFGNNTVRAVEVPTANYPVSTLMGVAGATGRNDSPARFNNPSGVAVDWTAGIAYVADTSNRSVRSVVLATGVTSTLYQGSSPYAPTGITLAGNGTLYVADGGGSRIFTVDKSTGAHTLLAGSATQTRDGSGTVVVDGLYNPQGLAVDSVARDVYVADANNSRIIRINGGTWYLVATTVLDVPVGLALNTAKDTLYVSDAGRKALYTIGNLPSGGTPTPFAGVPGTAGFLDGATIGTALFSNPEGLALDSSDKVYLADNENDALRLITGGNVGTLAGIGGTMANIIAGAIDIPLPGSLALPSAVAVRPTQSGTGVQMVLTVPDAILTVGF